MNEGLAPRGEEFEQIILGSFLADTVDAGILDELVASDFYFEKHKNIFRALTNLREKAIPVDLVTVRNELERQGQLEEIGGSPYITYLTEILIPELNFGYYIGEIKRLSDLRNTWENCHKAIKAIEDGYDANEIDELIQRIGTVNPNHMGSAFRPISAKELQSIPPPQSLWGEIIYEGCVTLINSIPGVGKTTLCYNLCAYGSLSREFLELSFIKPLKVLYIDAETHIGTRKQKLENICDELPGDFYFLEIVDLRKDFGKLLTLCKKDKYDILVFDTLSRIAGFENENDNAEANIIMDLIRRITREAGCAVIIVHHTSKSQDKTGVYHGRGASAIPASADIVINLEELDEDTLKLKVEKNRIIGIKNELLLRKTGEDRFERHYSGTNQKAGFEIIEAQHLIMAMQTNTELTTAYICETGMNEGFTRRTMERAISGLVQSGKLKRIRKGVYIIQRAASDNTDNSARHNPHGTVGMAERQIDML